MPELRGASGVVLAACSVTSLFLPLLVIRDFKWLQLVYLPLVPAAVFYVGYLASFRQLPGDGLLTSLLMVNFAEVDGIRERFSAAFIVALGIFGVYLLTMLGGPVRVTRKLRLAIVVALAGCLVASVVGLAQGSSWGARNSFPFGLAYQVGQMAMEDRANAERSILMPVVSRMPTTGKSAYVFMVGETVRRDVFLSEEAHSSALKRRGVVVLANVIAQAPYTKYSVPMLLTGQTTADAASAPNFAHFAKASGCTPVWITANNIGKAYEGVAAMVFDNWRVPRGMRHRDTDDELLPLVEDALKRYDNVCVVLHTQGSHNDYMKRMGRYPARYAVDMAAYADPGNPGYRTAQKTAYRNTIAMTQELLTRLMAMLERRGGRSMLLFAPDHGENLWDDDRQLSLHGFGTRAELDVSAVFWASPELIIAEPGKWKQLQLNTSERVANEDMLPTLLDFMDVRYSNRMSGQSLAQPYRRKDHLVRIDSLFIPYRMIR